MHFALCEIDSFIEIRTTLLQYTSNHLFVKYGYAINIDFSYNGFSTPALQENLSKMSKVK